MTGSFDARGQIDWADGRILLCVGKKRSGKSVMGLVAFRSYPWDKIVVDVAHDDGPWGPDVIDLHGSCDEIPRRWPEHLRPDKGVPMILRYTPDPGSPTYLEDIDAVIGLALHHGKVSGHCMVLVHEGGAVAKSGRTPPHCRRLLMQNRHCNCSAIFCAPRMIGMDPLVGHQADLVYGFEMPGASDRRRLAEDIGWSEPEVADAIHDLGPHEYLRYDSNWPKPEHEDDEDYRLVHFPAIPADVVANTLKWARGGVKGQGATSAPKRGTSSAA